MKTRSAHEVAWQLPKDIPYHAFTGEFQAKGIGFRWSHDHFVFFGPRAGHARTLANAAVKRLRKAGLSHHSKRSPIRRASRSPVSQIVAKKTFYSGKLVLTVHLLEGHHVEPRMREKQVRGCKHNVVYRVTIKPAGEREAMTTKQFVCPPAHLEHGLDSLAAMRSSAHAALSFADHEGWPVSEYAAFSESGWHVGATKLHAWPREKKR